MPKQSSSLPLNGEVVRVALPRLDGALSHICRSICPPAQHLPNAVPDKNTRSPKLNCQILDLKEMSRGKLHMHSTNGC